LRVFAATTKRLRESTKIKPFQMRLLEITNGMIEIEAVNVAGDPHCAGPDN
jgi:hypothetical protein